MQCLIYILLEKLNPIDAVRTLIGLKTVFEQIEFFYLQRSYTTDIFSVHRMFKPFIKRSLPIKQYIEASRNWQYAYLTE